MKVLSTQQQEERLGWVRVWIQLDNKRFGWLTLPIDLTPDQVERLLGEAPYLFPEVL